MLSTRLPDDTLFFYFEADFRFHAEDCLETDEWLPFLTPEPVARSGNFSGAEFWKRPRLADSVCSPELVDVVRICNQAARTKDESGRSMGHLIWMGWNAAETGSKTKTKHKIQYGSHAIAFTKTSAELLLQKMKTDAAEHFDLWLKRILKKKN